MGDRYVMQQWQVITRCETHYALRITVRYHADL